jgi:hypothetical protein
MRRTSSTIPFGYKLSKDSKYLEVIPEELKSLKEIKNLVQSKSLSLREGANWLYYQTGRPISHVGLKKIIDNGRLDKKPK